MISTPDGSVVLVLDSEAGDPAASALSATLTQGSYQVFLQDGWTLGLVGDGGIASAVSAALLTRNPQTVDINTSADTNLSFTFTTEDGVVDIGSGSLNVSVDVAPNTGLAPCDLLSSVSCPSGQTCLLAGASGRTFCASPGSLPLGSPCSSQQCRAGSQCLRLDPDHPDHGACTSFCDTRLTVPGCNCVSLAIANSSAGICTSAPPPPTCDDAGTATTMSILDGKSPDCLACAQAIPPGSGCELSLLGCEPCADPGQPSCIDTLQCVIASSCVQEAFSDLAPCYCGTAIGVACLTPGAANGVCKTSIETGLGSTDPSFISSNLTNQSFGTGKAMQLAQCLADYACQSCF